MLSLLVFGESSARNSLCHSRKGWWDGREDQSDQKSYSFPQINSIDDTGCVVSLLSAANPSTINLWLFMLNHVYLHFLHEVVNDDFFRYVNLMFCWRPCEYEAFRNFGVYWSFVWAHANTMQFWVMYNPVC